MTRAEFLANVKKQIGIDLNSKIVLTPMGFAALLEMAGLLEPNEPDPTYHTKSDADGDKGDNQ